LTKNKILNQKKSMMRKLLLGLLTVALFAGCNKNKCDYNECAIKAPDSEIQAVQNYLSSKGITTAVQHCSGMFYVIDNNGTGKHPTACSSVNVTYKGMLTNGSTFDQGTIDIGLDGVVTGWRNGIPKIGKGGIIHLYIPPTLGYGSYANGPIPANSILVFDVTLNGVN
jgi:FKBP-type peptidyl-prolyl cis-trans isomerase FkpA